MSSTVGISVEVSYNVDGSYQAELQDARPALEKGEYHGAIFSAHRVWQYYGEFVLSLLGKTQAELDDLAEPPGTLGLTRRSLARATNVERATRSPNTRPGRSSSRPSR